jgi:S1-C subfamily serine protease
MKWLAWVPLVCGFLWVKPVSAEPALKRLAFLGVRQSTPGKNAPIDYSALDYRPRVQRQLKAAAVNVVTWNTLPDVKRVAELALGGSVAHLECARRGTSVNCRMGVKWELIEPQVERIVYTTVTYSALYGVERETVGQTGLRLLAANLDSLLARPGFGRAQKADPIPAPPASEAELKRCVAPSLTLPQQAEAATAATVVVQAARGVGSGFFVNDEGLMFTAAHVANRPELKIRLRDGRSFPAAVVRINVDADVALIRADVGSVPRCLELATKAPSLGMDAYVIGTPAGAQQAFSLSRGIVSALRDFGGLKVVQTDAAVSPGNSGGPLLGADGRALGIVNRKLVHEGVEGIAYAVLVDAALEALKLKVAASSGSELSNALPPVADRAPEWETDDALPALDPPVPLPAAKTMDAPGPTADQKPKPNKTPAYVGALRWGGLGVGLAGLVMVVKSVADNDPDTTTRDEFAALKTLNTVGWVLTGVGASSFAASFVVQPASPGGNTVRREPLRIGVAFGASY